MLCVIPTNVHGQGNPGGQAQPPPPNNSNNNKSNHDKHKDYEQVHGNAAISAFTLLEIVSSEETKSDNIDTNSNSNSITNNSKTDQNDTATPINADKINKLGELPVPDADTNPCC